MFIETFLLIACGTDFYAITCVAMNGHRKTVTEQHCKNIFPMLH